ncbi:uncharacterized protein LOC113149115 [Anabas testudineus]|uniref:uncharacterized protein LOC113149115 n=1 Tax=Anabas testudineus TaxID=64144 RepID=UPI000E45D3B9|nr:uncharacterized protein LOC113149115 [Anabas testudineus]
MYKKQQLRACNSSTENKREMRERRTMSECKRIQTWLFLVLILQFTVTGQCSYLTVRYGDNITVSCEHVKDEQDECRTTAWIFSYSQNTTTEELVRFGQISESKPDRLSVTENCSLVIEKVTDEDVGLYTCRQRGQDSVVDLSVVIMPEHKNTHNVTIGCSVWTDGHCRHTVKWLYHEKDVDTNDKDLTTSQTYCYAAVSFLDSHVIYKSNNDSLKCEVTDPDRKVQQFPFRPQNSGDGTKPATTASTRTVENTTTAVDDASNKQQDWWWLVMVIVGLVALMIIVVAVIRYKRRKGNNTQKNDVSFKYFNNLI